MLSPEEQRTKADERAEAARIKVEFQAAREVVPTTTPSTAFTICTRR
ncbi:hypothetical protein ABZ177_22020 [Streptomyces sp. NPDC006284]